MEPDGKLTNLSMTDLNRPLTILFVPMSSSGHVNAGIGLAEALKKRGHRVVFAVEFLWKGKLANLGFQEEIYFERPPPDVIMSPNAFWACTVKDLAPVLRLSAYDKMKEGYPEDLKFFVETLRYSEPYLRAIVANVKPDLVIEDNYLSRPSLITAPCPYIYFCSSNPTYLEIGEDLVPPYGSGLPSNDNSEWQAFRAVIITRSKSASI